MRKEGHAGNWIEEELRVPKKRKRKQEEVPYWPQAFATESAGGSEAEGGDLRELLEGFFAWVAGVLALLGALLVGTLMRKPIPQFT